MRGKGHHGKATITILNNLSNKRPLPCWTSLQANYATFPKVVPNTFPYLKWLFSFGAAMVCGFPCQKYLSSNLYFQAVSPEFYVSRERLSSVQVVQFSNGLTNPIGLWLGVRTSYVRYHFVGSTFNNYYHLFCHRHLQFYGLARSCSLVPRQKSCAQFVAFLFSELLMHSLSVLFSWV